MHTHTLDRAIPEDTTTLTSLQLLHNLLVYLCMVGCTYARVHQACRNICLCLYACAVEGLYACVAEGFLTMKRFPSMTYVPCMGTQPNDEHTGPRLILWNTHRLSRHKAAEAAATTTITITITKNDKEQNVRCNFC